MEILGDKHRVLITINHEIFQNDEQTNYDDIISFFENFINSNQYTINPSLIYNYFYNIKIKEPSKILDFEDNIVKLLNSKIRETRNNFRKLHRTNNLKILYVVNFLKDFYQMLKKIDTFINSNSKDSKKQWGSSNIITKSIFNIYNNLLVDNCIMDMIKLSVQNYDNIFQFIRYIKIISNYDCSYENFVTKIEEGIMIKINNNIQSKTYLTLSNISDDFKLILKFRDCYGMYKLFKKNYNYVIYDKNYNIDCDFKKCLNSLIEIITEVVIKFRLPTLIEFVNTYLSELKYIHKNMVKSNLGMLHAIFFDKFHTIDNFTDFIDYGSVLFTFIEDKYILNLTTISNTTCIMKNLLNDDNLEENIINISKKISNNILNNNISQPFYIYYFFSSFNGNTLSTDIKSFLIKFLEKELIFRIIYHKTRVTNEIINYNHMLKYFSEDKLYNYRMILYDFENSNQSQIMITPEIWGINSQAISINFNYYQIIGNVTYTNKPLIQKLYLLSNDWGELNKQKKTKKNLFLHPHFGSVDINFNSELQSTNIIMLPIQMLVLEQCRLDRVITKQDLLITFPSYANNKKIVSNIILIFLEFNIVIDDLAGGYYLNNNYSGKKHLNLIKRYNELENTEVVVNDIIFKELAHNKELITSSVINNILKKNSNCLDHKSLYEQTRQNISVFNFNQDIFKKSITDMIRKDYIRSDGDSYTKLF